MPLDWRKPRGRDHQDPRLTKHLQGVSAGISPYFTQMSQQGAAGLAGRGGLGGGAEDYMQSQLMGQKLGIMGGASADYQLEQLRAELARELAKMQEEPWWQSVLKAGASAAPFFFPKRGPK